jgi:hypothetical protein
MRILLPIAMSIAIAVSVSAAPARARVQGERKAFPVRGLSPAANLVGMLSPWDLLIHFASDIDNGLQGWKPRCILLTGSCGAAHRFIESSVEEDRSVWFNSTAAAYISNIVSTTNLVHRPVTAVSFPQGSVIARLEWAVVKQAAHPGPNNGTAIPIYDPTNLAFNPAEPLAGSFVSIPKRGIALSNRTCQDGPLGGGPIPLGCFVSFAVTQENVKQFQTDRLNVSPGDLLVLLGFHLIVKSGGQWRWSTFWWQSGPVNGRPGASCFSVADVCGKLTYRWRHYLMDAVILPQDPNSTIRPVMNPYIEGSLFNNKMLNCLVCHSFAGSPIANAVLSDPNLGPQGPTTRARVRSSSSSYMTGRTASDSVWSMAKALSGSGTNLFTDRVQFGPAKH